MAEAPCPPEWLPAAIAGALEKAASARVAGAIARQRIQEVIARPLMGLRSRQVFSRRYDRRSAAGTSDGPALSEKASESGRRGLGLRRPRNEHGAVPHGPPKRQRERDQHRHLDGRQQGHAMAGDRDTAGRSEVRLAATVLAFHALIGSVPGVLMRARGGGSGCVVMSDGVRRPVRRNCREDRPHDQQHTDHQTDCPSHGRENAAAWRRRQEQVALAVDERSATQQARRGSAVPFSIIESRKVADA